MSLVETLIVPRTSDLGDGVTVRRALPSAQRRTVGPFVFLDEMGPVSFEPGAGMDVRPHPHIGLSTVTYLYEGAMMHRDGAGNVQEIRPGEVNWMTSGRGITHSERTPPDVRESGQSLHGIQVWVALPQADAELEPEFHHHERATLPRISRPGVEGVLIAGDAYGERSPVRVFAPMFMLEVNLAAGAELDLPGEHAERGVHVVDGEVSWGELEIGKQQMAVQAGDEPPVLRAREASRVILFGGAPLDGERHLWWNFVASGRERIEQAKADWREGRFPVVPGDDQEFIPLPD